MRSRPGSRQRQCTQTAGASQFLQLSGYLDSALGRARPCTGKQHSSSHDLEEILVVEIIEDAVRRQHEDVAMLHGDGGDCRVIRHVLVVLAAEDGGLHAHPLRDDAELVRRVEVMGLRRGVVVDSGEAEEHRARVSEAFKYVMN